ncbi:hypothetical protein CXG81DRAFT_26623 [Caulochytrium protostelioides]|uniref:Uncharacterized protein n=1 Tax=Caulochytrium protostelioides TaxID=1555241 RepID=A0A4P9X674_9FUNG|nr:hypothetical protein CXG81DRAFT_26623 [Caulochytrium protostelioides]|eukprot:RKP00677.1 hypothetical protein CXG81DRAFT_26623 [Caulochytrium protostelioides]
MGFLAYEWTPAQLAQRYEAHVLQSTLTPPAGAPPSPPPPPPPPSAAPLRAAAAAAVSPSRGPPKPLTPRDVHHRVTDARLVEWTLLYGAACVQHAVRLATAWPARVRPVPLPAAPPVPPASSAPAAAAATADATHDDRVRRLVWTVSDDVVAAGTGTGTDAAVDGDGDGDGGDGGDGCGIGHGPAQPDERPRAGRGGPVDAATTFWVMPHVPFCRCMLRDRPPIPISTSGLQLPPPPLPPPPPPPCAHVLAVSLMQQMGLPHPVPSADSYGHDDEVAADPETALADRLTPVFVPGASLDRPPP